MACPEARKIFRRHEGKDVSPLRKDGSPSTVPRYVENHRSRCSRLPIGVTKWMRANGVDGPVWQRHCSEPIIRTDRALDAIWYDARENPWRWHLDRYNRYAPGTAPPGT